LVDYVERGDFNGCQKLLEAGADPNRLNSYGISLIHTALWRSEVSCCNYRCHGLCIAITKCIKLLLKYGTNPNIQDNLGNTLLHIAINYRNLSCIKILLDYRTNPDILNNKEISPRNIAENNRKIRDLISEYEIPIKNSLD
jgi:ankyrin repeat protein